MLDINIIIIQNLSGNLYFFPIKFPLETEISSKLQLTGSRLLPSGAARAARILYYNIHSNIISRVEETRVGIRGPSIIGAVPGIQHG